MTEESGPQGIVDYTYDAANRRTKVAVGGLTAVTYQYDAANRLTQIAQGTAASVSIVYDAANRRSSVTLPNGIVATPQFDAANELTSLSYDRGGAHIADLAYTYDQAGQRSSQSGSLAALRLPTSITHASYDAGNRLTNWGGTPLGYDANGNLLNAGTSSYTWNTRDQLVASSDGGASFAYDALGRQTSRVISASTDSYLYDGFNVSSLSGNQILNGEGIDELYAYGGASSSLLTDGIGSTLAITDSAGNISGSYTYGPYGNTSHTGSATAPNQYSGRENDGDTNLYYYRARYYSPTLNRFISQDPIGLGGGMNVYAYVNGNPISDTDPLGLKDWNEQETLQLLQQAYSSSTAGRIQGLLNIYNNSKGNGPYDFGWNEDTASDTWTRCGVKYDADHFANYVAGFQGAAYDSAFFWTTGGRAQAYVYLAGIGYHLAGKTKAVNDPLDLTGIPLIYAGTRDGWNFPNKSGCGCDQ